MLSFILSKMNMMIFATGVFIVAFVFLGFITNTGDTREALSLLQSKAKVIEEQLSTDSLCTLKVQSIPDTLTKGIGSDYLFYEMSFSTKALGGGKSALELSISERNKETIIASQSVYTYANIFLINPDYLIESEPVDNYFLGEGEHSIKLYPRGKTAPNSFVILKEVILGEDNLYIIPCTSYVSQSCTQGITKVGCYLLKKRSPAAPDAETVPSCFNVSLAVEQNLGETISRITKTECKNILGEGYFLT